MTETAAQEVRNEIDKYLREDDFVLAKAALGRLWRARPSAATARYLIACFERMRNSVSLQSRRIGILRSFTLEPVIPIVKAAALTHGLNLSIQMGQLNTYAQQILDPHDGLYKDALDLVILAVHTRDIASDLWEPSAKYVRGALSDEVEKVVTHFHNLVDTFRRHSSSILVIHTLESPMDSADGILDAQRNGGQLEAIRTVNVELGNLARRYKDIYILDYDAVVARFGRERWADERMWTTVKLPMSPLALVPLADHWLQYICPALGRVCKVLVTDLDNTLWHGVVGEDGLEGIQARSDYLATAYLDVQRALLTLRNRGILLAIASKNNREDACAVFSGDPNMILRPEHFAAERINWDDKPRNLRSIAAELNVGLDSLAFLDDNPIERDRVRAELPEVTVIELPEDAFGYAPTIRNTPELQRLRLSEEDTQRSNYYVEQRQRNQARANHDSVESFYHWLKQKVEISPLTERTAPRIAQLTQKTNQFNATTKRYTEQQIAEMAESPGCEIFSIRAEDHFGDNGIVGVLISKITDGQCEIDTFLLSCRAISRTIETAMLAFLVERCRAKGIRILKGWITPTPKNEPVRSVYEKHGFGRISCDGERSLWSVDIATANVPFPEWIEIKLPQESAIGDYAYR